MAADYLQQQGRTFVVVEPGDDTLLLGLGSSASPAVVPHCIAFLNKVQGPSGSSSSTLNGSSTSSSRGTSGLVQWCNSSAAQAALQQACRALHVKVPDPHQPPPAVPLETIPEGSDGFQWTDTLLPSPSAAAHQDLTTAAALEPGGAGLTAPHHKPFLFGSEVMTLPPAAPYTTFWPFRRRRLVGAGVLPDHLLQGWLTDLWGWVLQHELELPPAAWPSLGVVLLLPESLPAQEVALLADVLLVNMGFSCMVAHLAPVAATFGHGTTTACVVQVGTSVTSVTCVEDGMVTPGGRALLPMGLASVGRGLQAWMTWQGGRWPQQLQPGEREVDRAAVLRLLQEGCYCPWEEMQSALAGQPTLEDQGPVQVSLKSPGSPTQVLQLSLHPWDAIASLALFIPALAPPSAADAAAAAAAAAEAAADGGEQTGGVTQGSTTSGSTYAAVGGSTLVPGVLPSEGAQHAVDGAAGPTDAPASDQGVGAAATAEVMEVDQGLTAAQDQSGAPRVSPAAAVKLEDPSASPQASHTHQQHRKQQPASSSRAVSIPPVTPSPWAVSGALGTPAAAPPTVNPEAEAGSLPTAAAAYPTYHALVEEHSAAESIYLAAQWRMRSEAGEQLPPPVGAYLAESAEVPLLAAGLDQAVADVIRSAAPARPELQQRLAAGLLLVGEGAGLQGLPTLLERRVRQHLAATPETAALPVAVLDSPVAPHLVAWKGGALLGALDALRDNWLQASLWTTTGPAAVGRPGPRGTEAAAIGAAGAGQPSGASGVGQAAARGSTPSRADASMDGEGEQAATAAAGAKGGPPGSAGAGRRPTQGAGQQAGAGRAAGSELRHARLFYYLKAQQGGQ